MAEMNLGGSTENVTTPISEGTTTNEIPEEADRKFALCSAMVYLLWRGKDEKDEAARITGFYRICLELSSDFASMALLAAMEGNDKEMKEEYSDKLIEHPLFEKWRAKHKDALTKHMKKFKAYGI